MEKGVERIHTYSTSQAQKSLEERWLCTGRGQKYGTHLYRRFIANEHTLCYFSLKALVLPSEGDLLTWFTDRIG